MAIDDNKIIQLYFDRDENAISATSEKYGKYCNTIAINILGNKEDAEECLSDTYLKTWNSIPPNRPAVLRTFIGKITRNVAFDLYKKMNAEIRVLKALSRFLKGEIDITLYSEAYRAILEEEQLRQIWPGVLQLSS